MSANVLKLRSKAPVSGTDRNEDRGARLGLEAKKRVNPSLLSKACTQQRSEDGIDDVRN